MLTIGSHIAAGRLALMADLPRKKTGCKCGCAGNCAEKKAIAKLIEASKAILAGGPGSGRHPEHGTFNRTGMTSGRNSDDTYYKSKSGNSLVRVSVGTGNRKTTVHETNYGQGPKEKQVFQTYRQGGASQDNDFHGFLNDRYGIKV